MLVDLIVRIFVAYPQQTVWFLMSLHDVGFFPLWDPGWLVMILEALFLLFFSVHCNSTARKVSADIFRN